MEILTIQNEYTADGKPLPSNARIEGNYLVIPEASVEDDSMYMCRATNPYGSAEGGAQLQVRGEFLQFVKNSYLIFTSIILLLLIYNYFYADHHIFFNTKKKLKISSQL